MRVFVSSLITGYEAHRQAARSAIASLGHQPVMAEDFSSQPNSPQIACLQGVRSSDLVVLVLVDRYGTAQASGVSPTHEEYLEARDTKPILAFVQEGVAPDAAQTKFVSEVQGWMKGQFRAGFKTAEELRNRVTRAVHEFQLSQTAGPLDTPALLKAATALLPGPGRREQSRSTMLHMAMVGGPQQRVLRPSELEDAALIKALHKNARFADAPIFDDERGTESLIEKDTLVLQQEGGAQIQLDEHGSLRLRLPLDRSGGRDRGAFGGLPALIEESVVRELTAGIAYAAWTLDKVDPTHKLTHVAVASMIDATGYVTWRTQAEHEASPNRGSVGFGAQAERPPISVDRPRGALTFEAQRLAVDLMVPLRRQFKGGTAG
jgi:Domain of unknown function (DUF4062)